MLDQLAELITDEGKWLTASMAVACLGTSILLYKLRHSTPPRRVRVMAAMTLFAGLMIGSMALGHLLAVSTKLALGTLEGSLVVYYAIGIALALPSWLLALHTRRLLASLDGRARATVRLNAWLAITLLGLGIHNLPLAAPSLLNIGYHLHTRRSVGWAIVTLAVLLNLALFIGSLLFLASGQSFEEYMGIA